MEPLYKIKKGLDIMLEGAAEQQLAACPLAETYAVKPADFNGIVPKLAVKEGCSVKAGDPLFVDKATEKIAVVSPVSGTVKAIERGERRKLLRICIESDGKQDYKSFNAPDPEKASGEEVQALMLEAGMAAFLRQRPYDVIADPEQKPKSIFVSAFSTMPLAADFSFVAKGREGDFKTGIAALSRIAPVYVGINPQQINSELLPITHAKVSVFSGPNPAGNVGVQINHIDPVNKGETVWTMGAEHVIMLGELFRTGKVNLTRRIAVAGSMITAPAYVETLIGAPMTAIIGDKIKGTGHVRIIGGNPLVGERSGMDDYLGAFCTEVCAIPEGDDVSETFGWIMPRLNQFSTSRSYFSWLFGKSKKYDLDCRIKGGERHIIMSGEYDRVFPMDIYAGYLIKAIITGDIDRQEALGIYEVAPEDFAVAEFVDSSKLELQNIVRESLDLLRKENA
ncbi:MAG: Na(+)-translocating NADH-quinone reductase subunit A [Bacteroidales bacterium]|nr:Na(+)-translocating NADH-quinone reductase subunit A [Bacteroidales bacterium]